MVERFHRRVGFPTGSELLLENFSENLNRCSKLTWSLHAKDKLGFRTDLDRIESMVRICEFDSRNVFEFYRDTRGVSKVCYRYPYSLKEDIILVVSRELLIVTVYFNKRNDRHSSLTKTIYRRIESR